MQDQYVGDIADYARSALLRALSKNRQLGVAWYLRPDAGNTDGKHIDYLKQPEVWRRLDEGLFDGLKDIIDKWKSCVGERSVAEFEKRRLLPTEVFAGKLLDTDIPSSAWRRRRKWRADWFEDVMATLSGCDIVFADPDNGLYEDGTNGTENKWSGSRKKDLKRLPLKEACQLAKKPDGSKRTAIIYHHNTRLPGGHRKEIQCWMKRLPGCTHAFYWQRYSNRTFFVLNPYDGMEILLKQFADTWKEHGELIYPEK